jgi:hypothetical protein
MNIDDIFKDLDEMTKYPLADVSHITNYDKSTVNIRDIIAAARAKVDYIGRECDWSGELEFVADDNDFTANVVVEVESEYDQEWRCTRYESKLTELELIVNDWQIINLTPIL